MNVLALPGVGPAVAAAIAKAFPQPGSFEAALQAGDLAALARVEGLSPKRAVALVRQARGLPPDDAFLGDPDARRVWEKVHERLLRYASTPQGRDRLRLLHAHPNPESAAAAMEDVQAAKNQAAALDHELIRSNLRKLRPFDRVRPAYDPGRMVVAENAAILDKLHTWGVPSWCEASSLEGLRRAEEHDLVVVITDEGFDLDGLDHVVELGCDATFDEIIPDATIAWAQSHRPTLEALAALAEATGRRSVAPDILAALEVPPLRAPAVDIQHEAEALLPELDEDLRVRLSSLELRGDDILAALQNRPPRALQEAMEEVIQQGRSMLRDAIGMDVAAFLPGPPITVDEDEVARAERDVQGRGITDAFHARQTAARRIAAARKGLEAELASWQEFDATYALGRFALEHGLRPATFGAGFDIRDSVHLDLARGQAQRIHYRLESPRVAMLTGANSGGKSTLLEHLAQLATMARFGLGVVGHATVPWVEELRLVTPRRGLDAGAFETFLRGFLPLATAGPARLVLVDEVEAVTEPEAAGKILAFFVERLLQTESLAVIVSHMAHQVLERVPDGAVRVDGIEARGLGEDNQLIVDRAPRMGHFARSTPELIVERLARTMKGPEQELVSQLLGALRGKAPK